MMRLPAAIAALAFSTVVLSDSGPPVPLVWHVEAADGATLASRDADLPINPASVVKVATTLWALERLGPEHRFETRFGALGRLDPRTGALEGDLVVQGTGDPDFHVENAYRVAAELNAAGLETVRGRLLVDERFWIGWEGGSARPDRDGRQRGEAMARRLRDVWDPARWDRLTRKNLDEFRARAGIDGPPPRVVVEGGVGTSANATAGSTLVAHRSNPLRLVLKRFNAFSNNDIERLGASLGTPRDLERELSDRWSGDGSTVSIETLSGLGSNRMTARIVVRLLRDLDAVCRRRGLHLEDVLPANGCDPGTLERFPRLSDGSTGSVVAKTGTLVHTDGGVAVLAGRIKTVQGERFFCVAAPRAGRVLARARAAEERWLLDLLARFGGAQAVECGSPVGHSDDDARLVSRPDAG